MGRDGKAKVVRDWKADVGIERVKAQIPRKCAGNPYCNVPTGLISEGTEFAMLCDGRTKRIGRQRVPDPKPYHFECVPEKAHRLLRFFRD